MFHRLWRFYLPGMVLLIIALGLPQVTAFAQSTSTAFSYQGELLRDGSPLGSDAPIACRFEFTLFDAAVDGNQVADTLVLDPVAVENGLFAVELDFGAAAFPGAPRFMQIMVQCPEDPQPVTLEPRVALSAVPYATFATQNWGLNGNAGTTAGTNFLGTTDAQPLELHAGSQRILRLEATDAAPNILGGYSGNSIAPDVSGATIAGGGTTDAPNQITAAGGTIGGGSGNTAGPDATVGGGSSNTASGEFATIAGGSENRAGGAFTTVGGGLSNDAFDRATTVAGGENNTVSNEYAAIGGGRDNRIDIFGIYGTIPGGEDNEVRAPYGFAAGRGSIVELGHSGAFVISDSNEERFRSGGPNRFSARFGGGFSMITEILGPGNEVGVELQPGSGSWSSLSDRNAKENFAAVDSIAVLEQLAELPLATWNYRSQPADIRHLGPTAQDFYSAFGLGSSNTQISTVDADGVALAAIQGLHSLLSEQATDLEQLHTENAALEQQLAEIEARLSALEEE